ncbi:MAG: AAA family ATPase, partial [Clostridiales bacterium]|nr:AAA family ATPase [Clostridiales bacterium]
MDFFESDNFNAEEIAEEREHLKETLALIKEQIALLENHGFSYRVVDMYDEQDIEEYRTDKFRHDERLLNIKILKGALSTPYFARMRLKQIEASGHADAPSMTRMRSLSDFDTLPVDADIYVGANVIFYKDKIIVYSHNSPLGNRIYDRFEGGVIEYGGYKYEVLFRRKFDIRDGKLEAVFQDYSKENGGVVYDKFLAHMLSVKRGDKRLTDIIPTIQANQNAIITRPPDENAVVAGCAGCGKTMILLQRLEYLSFNKKIELGNALVVCPSDRYKEHIQPVVDDLMIGAARRLTLGELYRELILSMTGINSKARRALVGDIAGDEGLAPDVVKACYGDEIKRKLITSLKPVKHAYAARLSEYRMRLDAYEREVDFARQSGFSATAEKPKAPTVEVDTDKIPFLPRLSAGLTKAKLYLLLTAYCYILGKPRFDSALFIDEGQEYYLNEYRLLAECTRATVNVYGDENQQLDPERGIGSLDKLNELWSMSRYSLNENYRNAREITAYVNDLLGMNVTSLGLEGGTVESIDFGALKAQVNAAVAAGDRV